MHCIAEGHSMNSLLLLMIPATSSLLIVVLKAPGMPWTRMGKVLQARDNWSKILGSQISAASTSDSHSASVTVAT